VGRRLAAALGDVLAQQIARQLEDELLDPVARAEGVQGDVLQPPWPEQRRPAGRERRFDLDLVRDVERVDPERRHALPIDRDAIADGLGVAFDPREADLERGFRRQRVDVPALERRAGRALGPLEGDDLERHAEHLGDLFREPSVRSDVVAEAPQAATHDLLAQELRLERLGEAPALAVTWPVELAHGIEREAHPGVLVALRLARVRLLDDAGVHVDRPFLTITIAEAFQPGSRDSMRRRSRLSGRNRSPPTGTAGSSPARLRRGSTASQRNPRTG
jgi:hypothetical protein